MLSQRDWKVMIASLGLAGVFFYLFDDFKKTSYKELAVQQPTINQPARQSRSYSQQAPMTEAQKRVVDIVSSPEEYDIGQVESKLTFMDYMQDPGQKQNYYDSILSEYGADRILAAGLLMQNGMKPTPGQIISQLDSMYKIYNVAAAPNTNADLVMEMRNQILSNEFNTAAFFAGRVFHYANAPREQEKKMQELSKSSAYVRQYYQAHGKYPSDEEYRRATYFGEEFAAVPEKIDNPAPSAGEVRRHNAEMQEQYMRNFHQGNQQVARDVNNTVNAANKAAADAAKAADNFLKQMTSQQQKKKN